MELSTRQGVYVLVVAGAVAGLAACSSGSSGGGGGHLSGTPPTIAITSPTAGTTVMVTKTGSEEDIPVDFTMTNFTLKNAGSCGSTANCGHVHVLIDGANSCGGPPYNNAEYSGSPTKAIVSQCSTVNGAHTISLELHFDDHSPVNGPDGKVIASSVQVTVQGG
jgi:hypothetical protein